MLLNPWQVCGDACIDAGKIVSGAFVAVGHQSDQHEIEAVTILLEFLHTHNYDVKCCFSAAINSIGSTTTHTVHSTYL